MGKKAEKVQAKKLVGEGRFRQTPTKVEIVTLQLGHVPESKVLV